MVLERGGMCRRTTKGENGGETTVGYKTQPQNAAILKIQEKSSHYTGNRECSQYR